MSAAAVVGGVRFIPSPSGNLVFTHLSSFQDILYGCGRLHTIRNWVGGLFAVGADLAKLLAVIILH
jgi:hypothetical protein